MTPKLETVLIILGCLGAAAFLILIVGGLIFARHVIRERRRYTAEYDRMREEIRHPLRRNREGIVAPPRAPAGTPRPAKPTR